MTRVKEPNAKVELPEAAKALKVSLKLPADKTKWKVGKTKQAREEAEQRLAIDLYEHYGYKGAGYEKHKAAIEVETAEQPVKPTKPVKAKGEK